MWIERVHIKGFGCLTERTYEFPEGKAILVLEDNECGKSTLAAAILNCLCGLPKRKQAGEKIKLSEVYKPWAGGAYAVEMDLRANGSAYHVERDFARGSFTIRDIETGRDVSAQCSEDLAYHFLRLPREDYARLAMLSGKEIHHFEGSATIQGRLTALVDGAEDSSGDAAIATLESVGCTLGGRQIKIETAIKRLNDDIAEKQSAIRELDVSLAEASIDAAAMDNARERAGELTNNLDALDLEFKAARLREVTERIAGEQSGADEIARLTAEMKGLERYSSFPVERGAQLEGAAARLGAAKERAAELENKMEGLRREAGEVKSRVDPQSRFADATSEDAASLVGFEDSVKTAADARAKRREAVDLERRALANDGIDTEASSRQWGHFERLTVPNKELLRSCREMELRIASDQREFETNASGCETDLGKIKHGRAKLRGLGKMLLAGGGLCALASAALILTQLIPMPAAMLAAVLAVGAIIAGAVELTRSGSFDADEKALLERWLDEAEAGMESANSRLEDLRRQMKQIADSISVDPANVVDDFREYERAMGRAETLGQLNAQLSQAEESLRSVQERATAALKRLGIVVEPGDDIVEALGRAREALNKYLADRDKLARLDQEIGTLGREIEKVRAGIAEEQEIAQDILGDAGIDKTLPLDVALKAFGEAERNYRRYREIRDSLLPAVGGRAVSDDTLAALRSEYSELEIALAGSDVKSTRASAEVESERESTRRMLGETNGQVRDLERRVGSRVDAYRSEYPSLRESLEALLHELAKVERFGTAISAAADVMREVSRDSRRKWASALNESASAMLPSLNHDYDTLRFDDSLSFTLRRVSNGRVIDKHELDSCLSTGAKDQVYLAVRLACCDELSSAGEPIPIILDDPLMAADDERFRSGFEYLAGELPKRHQVIILSCHKARHARLLDETWFAENVSVLAL